MTINKEELLTAGYRLTSVKYAPKAGLYLVGDFMFGDADGGEESKLLLDSFEMLAAIERYLAWKKAMPYNAEIDYRSRTKGDKMEEDFYAQAGEEWRSEYLWYTVQDWWPLDITGSDCPASLQSTWLVYSDGQHEWRVEK